MAKELFRQVDKVFRIAAPSIAGRRGWPRTGRPGYAFPSGDDQFQLDLYTCPHTAWFLIYLDNPRTHCITTRESITNLYVLFI